MNMIKAPNTKFRVIPAKSRVNAGSALPVRATKNTRRIVTKAPMNAATEINGIPQITVSKPNQIATTAPKELPADTPSVNGSAKEFRRSAWNKTPAMANAPPAMAAKRVRGKRATTKISRSGLTPATTFRHVTPVEPIQGATARTTNKNAAQGPMTARKRLAERPPSDGWNDVIAAAVRPFEYSGGDFEDVIKKLRRKNLIGRSIRHDTSSANGDDATRVSRRQIHVMGDADDRQSLLDVESLENIVELDLMF